MYAQVRNAHNDSQEFLQSNSIDSQDATRTLDSVVTEEFNRLTRALLEVDNIIDHVNTEIISIPFYMRNTYTQWVASWFITIDYTSIKRLQTIIIDSSKKKWDITIRRTIISWFISTNNDVDMHVLRSIFLTTVDTNVAHLLLSYAKLRTSVGLVLFPQQLYDVIAESLADANLGFTEVTDWAVIDAYSNNSRIQYNYMFNHATTTANMTANMAANATADTNANISTRRSTV